MSFEHEVIRDRQFSEIALDNIRLVQRELLKIESEGIRWFTYNALLEVDSKYWIAAASSTGKHHPPEDNGEGGLVRHVIKGTLIVQELARRARFSQRETDMAVRAFLLHDTCKDGVVWTKGRTDVTHGIIAAEWLASFELADETAKTEIRNAIRYHMTPWCYAIDPFVDRSYTREEMQANIEELSRAMYPSRIEHVVRDADYFASRENASFLPGRDIVFDARKHDTPEEWLAELNSPYTV